MKIFKRIYYYFADRCLAFLDFIKPLFVENEKLSLSRLAFFMSFGIACLMWIKSNWFIMTSNSLDKLPTMRDVPSGLLQIIMVLLVYNVIKIPAKAGANFVDFKIAALQAAASIITPGASEDEMVDDTSSAIEEVKD